MLSNLAGTADLGSAWLTRLGGPSENVWLPCRSLVIVRPKPTLTYLVCRLIISHLRKLMHPLFMLTFHDCLPRI